MAALIRARESLLGLGHSVVLNQEHGNLKCPVGVAAAIGAEVCGRGTIHIAPLLQQHTKLRCRAGVTALIRTRESDFGLGQPVLSEQERPQVKPGVGYSALFGAALCRLSAFRVAARRAQHAEIEGGGGVTTLVCKRKPSFGLA